MQAASDAVMTPRGLSRAHELAMRWQSEPGEEDLRGWEWHFFEGLTDGAPMALAQGEIPMWMAWHPNGERLAVLGSQGISFFSHEDGQSLGGVKFDVRTASFSALGVQWDPSGQLLSVTASGYALVCNGETGEVYWQIPGDFSATHAWSQDGRFLWAYGVRGTIMKLSAKDGSLMDESEPNLFTGNVLVVDENRGRILAGLQDLLVLDIKTMAVRRRIPGHAGLITHMTLHPTRDLVGTAGNDHSFWVWDMETGKPLMGRESLPQRLRYLCFDPSGKFLAVCSDDTTVEIWDWERGVVVKTIPWHQDRVLQAAWSPDGKFLASLAGGDSVLLYEPTVRLPYHSIDVLEERKRGRPRLLGLER